MTQTNTKLPREAFTTNEAYKEYQSFLEMIKKKGNMNTPCKKCNTLGKPCCEEHNGKLATQTNTTQNKEELQNTLGKIVDKYIVPRTIKKRELFALRWGLYGELEAYYKDVMARSNEWWNQKLKQSISQAHQSGIEEERKRLRKILYEDGCDNDIRAFGYELGKEDCIKTFAFLDALKENKQ